MLLASSIGILLVLTQTNSRSFNEEAKTGSEEEPHTKHSNRASTAEQEKLREEQNRCDRLVGSLKEFLEWLIYDFIRPKNCEMQESESES